VISEIIQKLIDRQNLTTEEARAAMDEILAGAASEVQIASFLTALRMKGETPDELVGFARVMRERAEPFWDGDVLPVLDNCGTGGDRSGTFNISTAASFVVAGAGIRVAKHGNRSATSHCGSADVMEALGMDIELPIPRLRAAVTEVGIGFLFAQRFHRSMRHVAPVRSQLKVRTVFNILGPLANPASARFQVVGVFSPSIHELMADALAGLGLDHAFVVHSSDGLDEISISAPTSVIEVHRGESRTFRVSPEDFGIAPAPAELLRGGDAKGNASVIESILNGERGPRRDVVLMNAAPAIVAAGAASGLKEGLRLAAGSIDSGKARQRLNALREWR
jgi:anthranilate phosphoribosyltransferase